jgi:4-diphosphocytidyl-2-C-methyl-D-erythritol kinase
VKTASAFAPAKINLFLHVGATASDGYHPLTSWMMFADVGDTLTLRPSTAMAFETGGPFGEGLPTDEGNLVVRARDWLLAEAMRPVSSFSLTLEKALPVASGMGGGSSDAAAALRLVGKAIGASPDDQVAIAKRLGSDVPACLYAQSVMARGRGDLLSRAPETPPLPVVLVNAGVAVSTAAIFRAFDAGEPGDLLDGDPPPRFDEVEAVTDFLKGMRNDLEAPAIALAPVIGEALALIGAHPEPLLTRMTGSGATVFAVCRDRAAARSLAARLRDERPGWWVADGYLS